MKQLSVILPTYNESGNLPILVERLTSVLSKIDYEIIVVDDNSPDKTYEVAAELARANPRIRFIRRLHERGLSSAVVTGMSSASGKYFAVMDADLQHDETILPSLLNSVSNEGYDIAIGSRAAEDGSFGDWSRSRRFMSWTATMMARVLLPVRVKDPMSGFFLVSREVFERAADRINPVGFKILLEFIGRLTDLKIKETGYTFRNRVHGETKLSGSVVRNYIFALIDLRFGKFASATFIVYCAVGITGVIVKWVSARFLGMIPNTDSLCPVSQGALLEGGATALSILNNYLLNNFITFSATKHKGARLLSGLLLFTLVSMIGLLVQIAVSSFLLSISGDLSNAMWMPYVTTSVGLLVAMVTNYYLNINFTWKKIRN